MLFGDEHLTLSEEVLGEGAFGVVNKGQLLSHGRPQDVAVKSIKGEHAMIHSVWHSSNRLS